MTRIRFILAVILPLAMGFVVSNSMAGVQDEDFVGWVKLGEAHAGRNPDSDAFEVDTPDINYAKIRFRVHGPQVHFTHVQVIFGDGDKEEIDMDAKVGNDGSTRPLGLHGKHRTIKRVNVAYQTTGHHRGGDGVVSLWGLKD